jgi:dienelactone hydrolase
MPAETIVEPIVVTHGGHRLLGTAWRPDAAGPTPTVIWYHGSKGVTRGLLSPSGAGGSALDAWRSMGLAVVAVSRRGYDESTGPSLADALEATEPGTEPYFAAVLDRLGEEEQDARAIAAAVRGLPWVDPQRTIAAGYSFGAILTARLLAADDAPAAGVAFALGAITWTDSPAIRADLSATAAAVRSPIMLVQAENDYSTAPLVELQAIMLEHGATSRSELYPPTGQGPDDGHVFCCLGTSLWRADVQAFLVDAGVVLAS